MITSSITLSAGQTVKFSDLGNFVRILAADAPVTIRTYKDGQVLTESAGVLSGYAEQFDLSKPFDAIEIYSATAQTVQIVVRLGQVVYYDQAPTGSVSISNTGGAFTQSRATVSNANVQILAAKADRRYLLVQNNDDIQTLRVSLDGSAATASAGFRVAPGSSLELPNFTANGAINVMMEAASALANNVEVVEA